MSASNGFSGMSVKELRTVRDKVNALIVAKEAEERAALREKIAAMAKEHGMTVSELFSTKGKGGKSAAVVRFRDPKNPNNTWAGRGRRPVWIGSRDPEQFRVSA